MPFLICYLVSVVRIIYWMQFIAWKAVCTTLITMILVVAFTIVCIRGKLISTSKLELLLNRGIQATFIELRCHGGSPHYPGLRTM